MFRSLGGVQPASGIIGPVIRLTVFSWLIYVGAWYLKVRVTFTYFLRPQSQAE